MRVTILNSITNDIKKIINNSMPKFLVERDWPNAGKLSKNALKDMAQQS